MIDTYTALFEETLIRDSSSNRLFYTKYPIVKLIEIYTLNNGEKTSYSTLEKKWYWIKDKDKDKILQSTQEPVIHNPVIAIYEGKVHHLIANQEHDFFITDHIIPYRISNDQDRLELAIKKLKGIYYNMSVDSDRLKILKGIDNVIRILEDMQGGNKNNE
jgi:hypothetical protein